MIRYEVCVRTSKVNSEITGVIEFNEAEFEGKTVTEREAIIDEAVTEWIWEHISLTQKLLTSGASNGS